MCYSGPSSLLSLIRVEHLYTDSPAPGFSMLNYITDDRDKTVKPEIFYRIQIMADVIAYDNADDCG